MAPAAQGLARSAGPLYTGSVSFMWPPPKQLLSSCGHRKASCWLEESVKWRGGDIVDGLGRFRIQPVRRMLCRGPLRYPCTSPSQPTARLLLHYSSEGPQHSHPL